MDDRTTAAARLLAEKLELDLPPELIAAALSQLIGSPKPGTAAPADTRPLAGIVGPAIATASAAPSTGSDLSELLPQLLKQLGSSDSPNRRAELAATASMLGALLGSTNKKPS